MAKIKSGEIKLIPMNPKRHDGVYVRCVWCGGENYMPAVISYSARRQPCAARKSCGKKLPEDYVKAEVPPLRRGNDGY